MTPDQEKISGHEENDILMIPDSLGNSSSLPLSTRFNTVPIERLISGRDVRECHWDPRYMQLRPMLQGILTSRYDKRGA